MGCSISSRKERTRLRKSASTWACRDRHRSSRSGYGTISASTLSLHGWANRSASFYDGRIKIMVEGKHDHLDFKLCVSGAAETGHCGLNAFEKGKALGREIARP